ncbi:hypothetical protein CDAR_399591 [Caerostris darwini]|uniref:Uncharacterized protein n=1 Tax=Caerostris darwini TaxID=1538125 RepID=A0AAV4RNA2_9ARAC|nr:hypothetical protein CDAR_399591 [Caerostris darwini]
MTAITDRLGSQRLIELACHLSVSTIVQFIITVATFETFQNREKRPFAAASTIPMCATAGEIYHSSSTSSDRDALGQPPGQRTVIGKREGGIRQDFARGNRC